MGERWAGERAASLGAPGIGAAGVETPDRAGRPAATGKAAGS